MFKIYQANGSKLKRLTAEVKKLDETILEQTRLKNAQGDI